MTENCIQEQNILVNILSLVKAITFHDTASIKVTTTTTTKK